MHPPTRARACRSCSRASERLLRAGVPATVIHRSFDDRGVAVSVAEAVSCFITAMDGLKLNLRAVDEIQPLLSDLMARCAHSRPPARGRRVSLSWPGRCARLRPH